MAPYDYDLITLGAGSAGVRASRMAARYGARVAVVEERDLGGTFAWPRRIENKNAEIAAPARRPAPSRSLRCPFVRWFRYCPAIGAWTSYRRIR